MRKPKTVNSSVAVVGGGLAGVCAALACARQGVKTVLINDRPVLGGNSSSEIGVCPEGAVGWSWHRETGIVEELLWEDRIQNHQSFRNLTNSIWDLTLYKAVREQDCLTLFLNTSVRDVGMVKGKRRIDHLLAEHIGAESQFRFSARYFVDCTGDFVVGARAGAKFMYGRESRKTFGESLAPMKADQKTQGSSLTLKSRDMGRPIKFRCPDWAAQFPDERYLDKRDRSHNPIQDMECLPTRSEYKGFWWNEVGAPYHTIDDTEIIRDRLIEHVLGIWEHIKTCHLDLSATMALDWVGSVLGKRESRRMIGNHILTQKDLETGRVFEDAVAYGGWPIDLHTMGGILARSRPPARSGNRFYVPVYTVPLRSLCSKNIHNLLAAGRDASASHIAHGSTRVMLTGALMGQAAGTAAAVCVRQKIKSPGAMDKVNLSRVQQELVKHDCFIPGIQNQDATDLARSAVVTASSRMVFTGTRVAKAEIPVSSGRLSQIIPLQNGLKAFCIRVKSSHNRAVITAQLHRAKAIWDYIAKDPMGKPVVCVVPKGTSKWLRIPVEVEVDQGLYCIALQVKGKICLAGGVPLPGVTCARKEPGDGRFIDMKVPLAMKVSPGQDVFYPQNIVSGFSRPYDWTNIWISSSSEKLPQVVELKLTHRTKIRSLHITWDTMLNDRWFKIPAQKASPECVSDYTIRARQGRRWRTLVSIKDNFQRKRVHEVEPISTDRLQIAIHKTNGARSARIYEVRVYA